MLMMCDSLVKTRPTETEVRHRLTLHPYSYTAATCRRFIPPPSPVSPGGLTCRSWPTADSRSSPFSSRVYPPPLPGVDSRAAVGRQLTPVSADDVQSLQLAGVLDDAVCTPAGRHRRVLLLLQQQHVAVEAVHVQLQQLVQLVHLTLYLQPYEAGGRCRVTSQALMRLPHFGINRQMYLNCMPK